MRAELGLSLDGAGQALLLATAGTIFSSLLSGRLLGRLATGTVLAGSTALAAMPDAQPVDPPPGGPTPGQRRR